MGFSRAFAGTASRVLASHICRQSNRANIVAVHSPVWCDVSKSTVMFDVGLRQGIRTHAMMLPKAPARWSHAGHGWNESRYSWSETCGSPWGGSCLFAIPRRKNGAAQLLVGQLPGRDLCRRTEATPTRGLTRTWP